MSPFIVTVFGAESTGKTTLSRDIARQLAADWRHEYARPYLERTGKAITRTSMTHIWRGQRALQDRATKNKYIVQDTDLYSTIGYWRLPHIEPVIGPCPPLLIEDATARKSNLYLITKSNIPFEADPLRYGGDRRESDDPYWIALCQQYRLPYVVIEASGKPERVEEAVRHILWRCTPCAAL